MTSRAVLRNSRNQSAGATVRLTVGHVRWPYTPHVVTAPFGGKWPHRVGHSYSETSERQGCPRGLRDSRTRRRRSAADLRRRRRYRPRAIRIVPPGNAGHRMATRPCPRKMVDSKGLRTNSGSVVVLGPQSRSRGPGTSQSHQRGQDQ